MCNREEIKLMEHNLGKLVHQQKTVEDVIKPSYAYQDIAPTYEVPRVSLLNPKLDGSSKTKLLSAGSSLSSVKKLSAGFDYKNIKKFLNSTIRSEL
jgi:hypothetical protein